MKKKSARWHLTIIIGVILIFCALRTYEKMRILGFSFIPNATRQVWIIETEIKFTANKNQPVNVTLSVPKPSRNLQIFKEEDNSASLKYDYKQLNDSNLRQLQWTKKSTSGKQLLYYKMYVYNIFKGGIRNTKDLNFNCKKPAWEGVKLQTAKSIIAEIKQKTSSDGEFTKNIITEFVLKPRSNKVKFLLPEQNITTRVKIETARKVLALNNIETALVFALDLNNENRSQSPILYLAFKDGNSILYANMLDINTYKLAENLLIFSSNTDYLVDITGGNNSRTSYAISKQDFDLNTLLSQQAKSQFANSLFTFSVYNLPISEQNTFKKLSVLPLAILMLVVMRNLVGIQGMGTFTPILISMVFLETKLLPGLIIFITVLTIGLLIRTYFSKLNLLLVPRISAVVIVVITIMQFISTLSYKFAFYEGLKVTFFPLIIFAWIIERSSIIWEEEGAEKTIKQIIFCLLTAIASYYIISNVFISHAMYVFNELNLIILILIMLIGSYSGYRLTELYRFRSFFKEHNNDN
ncbi:UUP1 family membrane protein [Lentisphaerota bacterium WC36G]|nr:inactive transglutaminase family protein [Lentisphaerae bacterium WC36]